MIISKQHKSDFVVISRALAQDENLSSNAVRLAVYLLSLPKSWNVIAQKVAIKCNMCVSTYYKALKELIDRGYLVKKQLRSKDNSKFAKHCIFIFENALENEVFDTDELLNEVLDENEQNTTQKDSDLFGKFSQTQNLHTIKERNLQKEKKETLQNENENEHICDHSLEYAGDGYLKASSKDASKPAQTPAQSIYDIFVLKGYEKQVAFLDNLLLKTKQTRNQSEDFPLFLQTESQKQAYKAFIQHKRQKTGKLSSLARKRLNSKLASFLQQGFDIASILNKAVDNNWSDIYAPKQALNGTNSSLLTDLEKALSLNLSQKRQDDFAQKILSECNKA